ncbi:MAG: contractile injection system tape measure protein, partial [Bacteroidota bacterium]
MKLPVHIIGAQEYEIVYDDASAAHRLQTAISGMQDSRIDPLLDQILDRFSSDEFVYQFETVELDLGSIAASNYENELIFRLEEALTAFLSSTIYEDGKLRDGTSVATHFSLLSHLEYYLTHGHFKWNSNPGISTSATLQSLLDQEPEALRSMLKHIGKDTSIRKRLIFQFDDAELDQIVLLVAERDG